MKQREQAKAVLQKVHEIDSRRYVGDMGASDIMIDFAAACKLAEISELQREAIALVYIDGLTQQTAADHLGVERSAFAKRIKNGITAIEEVYICWQFKDESEAAAA